MPETSEVRRYWDAHPISIDTAPEASVEKRLSTIYVRWQDHGNPEREAFLDGCRRQRVLEIGCGIAAEGRALSERGAHYHAVDLSGESLKLAACNLELGGQPQRLTHGDAQCLPFPDDHFDVVTSIGVLHHVPDTAAACREALRVLRPGGHLHIMLYARDSWHVWLTLWVLRPLVAVVRHLPGGDRIGPEKVRHMVRITRRHGGGRKRLLDVSTDTSFEGEGHFNPHSSFYDEAEAKALFPGVGDWRVTRTNLRAWPLPGRRWAERRWGFFLHLDGRKARPSAVRARAASETKRTTRATSRLPTNSAIGESQGMGG